ncbi:LAFA_0F13190g1_1 [Lachancea sp. 'fantastica']|nr:LAFA_0F13190g1_1 [Lachancea sp. 'fantastica']
MFAARFDPSQVQATPQTSSVIQNRPRPVVPSKRGNESDDESESESESASELEGVKESHGSDKSDQEEPDQDSDVLENTGFGVSHIDEVTNGNTQSSIGTALNDKHSGLYNRFQKTISLQENLRPSDMVDSEDDNTEQLEQHDLVPIPQPAVVKNIYPSTETTSAMSKSAAWLQTQKIHYDNFMVKPFASYDTLLNEKLLANIITKFSSQTFPVQTILLDTVLPKLSFAQSVSKRRFPRRVGDILVNASTGSGKTLAYSIPVVQSLSKRTVNRLRCLIVVPTKILIHQVFETLTKLSQGTSLVTGISKLENSLRDEHNKFQNQQPDILIITPGRLVDHLQLNSFDLKNLKFLILDEADRLLNQSFQNWCSVIMNRLKSDKNEKAPVNVIKMVFSATLTTNTEKLHNLELNRPSLFMMDSVKLYHLPKLLQEYNIQIPTAKSSKKPLFILQLICALSKDDSRILVFARSNEASLRLSTLLQLMHAKRVVNMGASFEVTSINSNNTKGLNNKLIKQFAAADLKNTVKVLVATDLMSRGIDIDNITTVINYDLPISSQQYVHRCGRTARAQAQGVAFNLLVGKGEQKFWSEHIDSDLSRDADGCHPQSYDEVDALKDILMTSSEVDEQYRDCLEQLKGEAQDR